jgi:ABC-type dipeptide/oligopeptide/nickel transport system ATPase component
MSKKTLLDVKNLKTSFFSHLGEIQAVRGSSFSLDEGDVLGIVGESGSGKERHCHVHHGADRSSRPNQGRPYPL